jgi:polysaccharide biosynthesis protein PslG
LAFDATLRSGITPFVTLVGGNRLYAPVMHYDDPQRAEIYGEHPAPPTNNDQAMAAWLRFVEAAITRYKDKIRYWEVWNEPNHRDYWGTPPDAADYGRLLRETATVIKPIEPLAKVIGGATAGMNAPFVAATFPPVRST